MHEKILPLCKDNRNLSEEQVSLLNRVVDASEVPLEEFADGVDELRELMSRGLLQLKISLHPWGLAYLVTRLESQVQDLQNTR